jgi:hypothetical protein
MAAGNGMYSQASPELLKEGRVVGLTDKVYPLNGGPRHFDEVLVKGDLSGNLEYNGALIRITRIDAAVGLKVDDRGARGPLWVNVDFEVVKPA